MASLGAWVRTARIPPDDHINVQEEKEMTTRNYYRPAIFTTLVVLACSMAGLLINAGAQVQAFQESAAYHRKKPQHDSDE